MDNEKIIEANTESIISTGEKIIQRHMQLGPASPLSNVLVADLNARISGAKQKQDEGNKYKKLMEVAAVAFAPNNVADGPFITCISSILVVYSLT